MSCFLFRNRRLKSGSEQIKLDGNYSLGYLSNKGHTLTVCEFGEDSVWSQTLVAIPLLFTMKQSVTFECR